MMKYAILFTVSGLLFLVAAMLYGGTAWLLIWPAFSFVAVGLGYWRLGPGIFGKRPDGTLPLWRTFALFPFLACLWTIWHVVRLVNPEPPHHELVDGILIGRRPLAGELPSGVTRVVDLTSEWPAPLGIREGTEYHCFPLLDASVPTEQILREALAVLATATTGKTLIHCANGHGRTGVLAAAFLIAVGKADTADEALQLVRDARPLAVPNQLQRRYVTAVCEQIPRM